MAVYPCYGTPTNAANGLDQRDDYPHTMAPVAASPQARLASQHCLLYELDRPGPIGGGRRHTLRIVARGQNTMRV